MIALGVTFSLKKIAGIPIDRISAAVIFLFTFDFSNDIIQIRSSPTAGGFYEAIRS
jgi:hypothetical protein